MSHLPPTQRHRVNPLDWALFGWLFPRLCSGIETLSRAALNFAKAYRIIRPAKPTKARPRPRK
jgi:hypothetical protein